MWVKKEYLKKGHLIYSVDNIMEIIDTPNPNARKIQTENSLFEDVQKCKEIEQEINKINGITSIFFGPDFITVSKKEDIEWESITQDIKIIFDKL